MTFYMCRKNDEKHILFLISFWPKKSNFVPL
jgi:hypothetical protein